MGKIQTKLDIEFDLLLQDIYTKLLAINQKAININETIQYDEYIIEIDHHSIRNTSCYLCEQVNTVISNRTDEQ